MPSAGGPQLELKLRFRCSALTGTYVLTAVQQKAISMTLSIDMWYEPSLWAEKCNIISIVTIIDVTLMVGFAGFPNPYPYPYPYPSCQSAYFYQLVYHTRGPLCCHYVHSLSRQAQTESTKIDGSTWGYLADVRLSRDIPNECICFLSILIGGIVRRDIDKRIQDGYKALPIFMQLINNILKHWQQHNLRLAEEEDIQ